MTADVAARRQFASTSVYAIDHRIITTNVTNLSNITLTHAQHTALGRGLKFIPASRQRLASIRTQLLDDNKTYERRLKLRVFFVDDDSQLSDFERKLYVANPLWMPPITSPAVDVYQQHTLHTLTYAINQKPTPTRFKNIADDELRQLKALAINPNVRICSTDKNLGPAVVNTTWYDDQVLLHLNDTTTYMTITEETAISLARTTARSIVELIESAPQSFPDSIATFIKSTIPSQFDRDTLRRHWNGFYLLVKIHKTPVKSRPITPSLNWVSTGLSKWIDATLQPHIQSQRTICTGTLATLDSIANDPDYHCGDDDTALVTLDVVALYPSIPLNDATWTMLRSLFTDTFNIDVNKADVLVRALTIVLSTHIIFHNNIYKRQVSGTAMGVACAVVFAQCYMLAFELKYDLHRHSLFFRRFIDDILLGVKKEHLQQLLDAFADADPDGFIKFTSTSSATSIDYLDLTIFKAPSSSHTGRLHTRLYVKPLNKFLYLPYSSMHPASNKRGFILGCLIRILRASSTHEQYLDDRDTFVAQLRRRGYPFAFIKKAFGTLTYADRHRWLQSRRRRDAPAPLIFSTTYNPHSQQLKLGRLVRQHWHIIGQDAALRHALHTGVLTPPLLAFRSDRKLRFYVKTWRTHHQQQQPPSS
jgi:hypothetical protein